MITTEKHICIITKNKQFFECLSNMLKRAKYECVAFTNAQNCLGREACGNHCDLMIADVATLDRRVSGYITKIGTLTHKIPFVVVGDSGDTAVAVKAIKAGAFDFVEKPIESHKLLPVVESAIKQYDSIKLPENKSLTITEKTILNLILHGRSNKEIARILHRSPRTIEYHRNHIMHKFAVHNLVDLVKRAMVMVPESKNLPRRSHKYD